MKANNSKAKRLVEHAASLGICCWASLLRVSRWRTGSSSPDTKHIFGTLRCEVLDMLSYGNKNVFLSISANPCYLMKTAVCKEPDGFCTQSCPGKLYTFGCTQDIGSLGMSPGLSIHFSSIEITFNIELLHRKHEPIYLQGQSNKTKKQTLTLWPGTNPPQTSSKLFSAPNHFGVVGPADDWPIRQAGTKGPTCWPRDASPWRPVSPLLAWRPSLLEKKEKEKHK